jgi:SAM-dependent methyltransferase
MTKIKKILKFLLSIINKNSYLEIIIKKKYRFSRYKRSHFLHLIEKIPQLKKLGLFDSSLNNYQLNHLIYNFFLRIIPILNKSSLNVFMRNELLQLRKDIQNRKIKDINLYQRIDALISRYNFFDGVVDRSDVRLHKDSEKKKIILEKLNYQKLYGAKSKIFNKDFNINFSKDITRGMILVEYFKRNINLFKKKKILHFSPEPELKNFFQENKRKFDVEEYSTNDLFGSAKYQYDITNLGFERGYFDLIICHRVMEHVFDDIKGFEEMKRVLNKNGVINFSVPQNMTRFKTVEWYLSDSTHNDHVRQYGMDLNKRLISIGLKLYLEDFSLKMDKKSLKKLNIYPMRIYNIYKV